MSGEIEMILIKILVENMDEKDAIVAHLVDGEEQGALPFHFTVKSDEFDEDKDEF